MTTKKKFEVFSAGCSTCKETIELVKRIAGSSHEVVIHDMHQSETASKAKNYSVRSVPANPSVRREGAVSSESAAAQCRTPSPRRQRQITHQVPVLPAAV